MIENLTEWFQNRTIELEDDPKKRAALLDMKSVVLNAEKTLLYELVRNVSVKPIFDCLSSSDSQEIELICVILFELLSQMSGNELLEVYGDLIQKSLSHPSEEVKGVILKLLEKTINENTIEILHKKHGSLLVDAAACLASSERSTAQGAILMLTKIGSNQQGLKVLYSNSVLNKLKEVMSVNDTSRFRVYEIVVAISNQSAENLSASVSSGIMGSLMSEISSSDILIQLNALEMLSSLARSNHGLHYLQECKVIPNLVDRLLKLNEEPLSMVLLPGLIEFFGNICALQPEHFTNEYPQVINLLFNSFETTDEVLLGVIISTVGKIGSSCSGRIVLDNYKDQIRYFFEKIGQILMTKKDLTLTAINCLCELLKNINGEPKLNEMTKTWFELIKPNALDSIVKLSKLPFVEFRLGAFAFLKTITAMDWGAEKVTNYPGMIEFLLDRSTEFNKDCKQTKYDVVFNIVQWPSIEHVVLPEVLNNLREFVKEGPFYVPTYVEMATEGAT